ncbi:Retroviral aspartyl protease, partial [Trichostrongylus colubriformis]
MDQSQLMEVFKEILEEQRRQHRELIQMLQHRVEDGAGDRVRTEDVTTPNVMAALSNRIEKFVFDADVEMGFSRWYSRYKEVFTEDARQLPESARVRLLCEKLDNVTFEKYQRHVLPRNVSDIGYQDTVDNLKHLFDFKASEFTTKYQCLKLEKNENEDYLTYTGRVNEFCEKAKLHDLDSDGIKCLLWIFGLKSQTEAEIRQRLIAILDREYRAGRKISLHELHQECENFLSLKRDCETIAGNTKIVESTVKEDQRATDCWNCEGNHYAKQCKRKPWFCKKCRTSGHREKFCDVANQAKAAKHTKTSERSHPGSNKTKHAKKPSRRHIRFTKISNASASVNASRMYIKAVVNDQPVSFLLDTGSDITLLNENVWKKMGSPQLEKANVTVKNASGDRMKIRGRLKCTVEMKGIKSVGYAYVTPYNSLMGLEWIQNNEDMLHHMKMMVAEINTKSSSHVEEELKRKYPEVFSEGLGLCTKEKADLAILPDAQPVFCLSRPVAYAARESIEVELNRLQEMGVITPVNHSEWVNLKR